MFTKAIVRIPSKSMINGITTANLGVPDYENALVQHAGYIEALQQCGVDVTILPADEAYPDGCFVEDTALLTKDCAIISRPGAASRLGEQESIAPELAKHYAKLDYIEAPGTLEPGDIMMVGSHFYIGLSDRTNAEGAAQMIAILEGYGMTGSMVEMSEMLHLKTGLSYLENNNLIAFGEFLTKPEFANFNIIEIDADESYAANCIWVNGTVLVPAGFPKAKAKVEAAGYKTIAVDVSEFEKLDGGLSCLSLRF